MYLRNPQGPSAMPATLLTKSDVNAHRNEKKEREEREKEEAAGQRVNGDGDGDGDSDGETKRTNERTNEVATTGCMRGQGHPEPTQAY